MTEPQKIENIILPDSPLAAERKSVTGWVSRDGYFYGDGPSNERTARYAGSTHSQCSDCGAICQKVYTKCEACRDKAALARFLAMPRAPWDGEQMVYSEARDRYYNEPDDAEEELEEGETLEDLRLILCAPNRARPLDEDYFVDAMPDDGDYYTLPAALRDAIDAFNKVAAECPPLSWRPGKTALLIDAPKESNQ